MLRGIRRLQTILSAVPSSPAPEELLQLRRDLEATERYLKVHSDPNQWPTFAAISEVIDDSARPPLDRHVVDDSKLTEPQKVWRKNGYLGPEELYAARSHRRPRGGSREVAKAERLAVPNAVHARPEILDLSLYPPLLRVMEELIGGEMILHLNFTGWVSSERNWHQDDYLNPPVINGW